MHPVGSAVRRSRVRQLQRDERGAAADGMAQICGHRAAQAYIRV